MVGMRVNAFDVVGLIAAAGFLGVVATDSSDLWSRAGELELSLTTEQRAAGFRSGVSWYGLYSDEEKVGFARHERRRTDGGFTIRQSAVVNIEVFGARQRLKSSLEADLDSAFALRTFALEVRSEWLDVGATGHITGSNLELEVRTGGLEQRSTIPLEQTPTLDLGVNALLLQRDLEIGARYDYPLFDPYGLAPRSVTVEYLGGEPLQVLDEVVEAHRFRRHLKGMVLDVLVNDVGEVVREELPFGVVAVRETEAGATWDLGQFATESAGRLTLSPESLALGGP